jgi:hypothetical protein
MDPPRPLQPAMDMSLPATWQQVWVLGLTESAQTLMKAGRFEEARQKMEEAARVADKFQICVEVQENADGPVRTESLAHLCAEALDGTGASRRRRSRRARRAISGEQAQSILAMTEKLNRGLERAIAQ